MRLVPHPLYLCSYHFLHTIAFHVLLFVVAAKIELYVLHCWRDRTITKRSAVRIWLGWVAIFVYPMIPNNNSNPRSYHLPTATGPLMSQTIGGFPWSLPSTSALQSSISCDRPCQTYPAAAASRAWESLPSEVVSPKKDLQNPWFSMKSIRARGGYIRIEKWVSGLHWFGISHGPLRIVLQLLHKRSPWFSEFTLVPWFGWGMWIP